jgi:hypothetical protein
MFNRKEEIQIFMEGNPAAEFHGDEWMCEFIFVVDTTTI